VRQASSRDEGELDFRAAATTKRIKLRLFELGK
jgi:hypothetical protein